MSFVLVGDVVYNDTTQRYELTPHQSDKSGSVILTGVAPCLNYKSVWDVLLSAPTSTGTEQMSMFFCQIDKEVSVEIGIHHNAISKSLTLSLSKTTDQGNSYSQSMKYVDNVDVTALITYGQTFRLGFSHFYGRFEGSINGQLLIAGSSGEASLGLETGFFQVVAHTRTNVYGKQEIVNYGIDPIFTIGHDTDVFGLLTATDVMAQTLKVTVATGEPPFEE
jgi:hypothetical protein